jgi:hypothetical protein
MFAAIEQFMQREVQARSGGNGKPAFLFGLIPLEANCGAGFSMQTCGIGTKPIVQFGGTGRAGGLADKFLQAVQAAGDDIRQRAQQAGPQNVNLASLGNLSSGIPRGDDGGREIS